MAKRRTVRAAADVAPDAKCATCSHMASGHTDMPEGDNSGPCTMKGCDCQAMVMPDAAAPSAPAVPAKPAPPVKAAAAAPPVAPAPAAPAAPADPPADDEATESADPKTLAQSVSDALSAALGTLSAIDMKTSAPEVQTFVALVHAADNCTDMLLTSLGSDSGVTLDDDAGDTNMLAETVDACIVAARNAGDLISPDTAPDGVASALAAITDADEASGDLLEALGDPDPDVESGTDPDPEAGEMAAGKMALSEGDAPIPASEPGGPAQVVEKTFTMPIMVIEGVDTGDGRYITPSCLTWRDLPLPVMAITKTTMGHDDAELVGRIDTIERVDLSAEINSKTDEAYGEGVTGLKAGGVFASLDEADRISQLIVDKFLRGVSVDIGDVKSTLEFLDENGEVIDPNADGVEDEQIFLMEGDIRESVTEGRVMGVTICPFPAFEGAYISVDGEDAATPATREEQADGAPVAKATVASIVNVDSYGMRECIPCKDGAPLVASAGPMAPPLAWFENPALDGPTPLTITDDGRIFGHLATWGVCHTGVAGQCVTAPKSRTNYGYFRTGAVQTADGTLVSTGPITLGGGHAGLPLGPAEAVKHYDEAGYGAADVACGDDRYGIWVAGAVRPDVTADQIRRLRASALSGDWRQVGGSLELVAALAVNVPGFPIVRAQIASGMTASLVAAGARGVMISAQKRALTDKAMLDSMRAQWPMMQSLLAERDERVKALRMSVKTDRMRHSVHAKAKKG